MKKILLAVLVLSLAVCCLTLTVTANAATEVAASDTLQDRGYINYGSDYYNITWNVDYGETSDSWWTEQPIVPNSGGKIPDYFGTGNTAIKIIGDNADSNNYTIGKFENAEGSSIKISKNPVKTYFQFDVDVEAFSMVNVWTSGVYTAIIYGNENWHAEGIVTDFQAQASPLGKGWRISYCIDMSTDGMANLPITINAGGVGAVYFANLIVAEIDTVRAPWVSSNRVTYNPLSPADVNVNLDTKGQNITGITCNSETVAAENYSYADETLTLKANAFNGKSGDLSFVVTTAGGSVNFTVTAVEEQTVVTASVLSDAINKYYDGTADVKEEISLKLDNVAPEHDVKLSYTAAYDSAEAGDRTITINLSLTGADASLYKLDQETLAIPNCKILPLISVTAVHDGTTIISKYEDDTTNVPSGRITLNLTGVETDDVGKVGVTFDAAYAQATPGTNLTIQVTNIRLTGDMAYKYQLTQNSLEITTGEIIARTVLTPTYEGDIEKRYDGTTKVNKAGINLTLQGIVGEDKVYATFDVAFNGSEVGDRQVQFTNIKLAGDDAEKYKLESTDYEKVGYILEVKDIAMSENKGYYTMDGGLTLRHFDFENVAIGSVASNAIDGLYMAPSGGEAGAGITQSAQIVEENGNKVLKVEENCFVYSTQLFSTNTTGIYREAGIYAVSFKVKPINSGLIGVLARNNSNNNETGILADYRYKVTNDETGKAIAVTEDNGGFLGNNKKLLTAKAEVDADGWIDCYFEFELPEGTTFEDGFYPQLVFGGGSVTENSISTYYFDDISYIKKNGANKYMTIDHSCDFEGENGTAATDTPFYSDYGFVYDNETIPDESVVRLDIPAGQHGQVGALKNSSADGENKLLLGYGIHYVQFDFDMDGGCTQFKLYSSGAGKFNYFAINCDSNYNFTYESDGCVYNFKTEKLANYMTRVSFVVDMTGSDYETTYLNLEATTGAEAGSCYFDNLIVSREDYTPLTPADTTYNLVGNDDVRFNVDLKGARLLGLELDGEKVAEDMYTYTYGSDTITLKKSLFAVEDMSNTTRNLTIITSEGTVYAAANLVDNRAEVTLTLNYTGEPIEKDYDGTTDVAQDVIEAIKNQIVMSGVTAGDDVDFTCDVVYSSKNAGAVTIEITIALTGAQADNYKLGTTSLSVDATINKIQLTVSGTTVENKVYDGNANADATAGTLDGVLTGEDVKLNISSATFNSKNVNEANKVTVVYALSGDDAANYLAPVSEDIADVSITKKTVTVTADEKTMKVGESEPALTYTQVGLAAGDTLTGSLTREEGTEVGDYDILQGTLSGGDNYEINFVSAKFSITEKSAEPIDPEQPEEPKGLSSGAIAGIVVGSVVVIGAAAAAVVFIIRKRRLK